MVNTNDFTTRLKEVMDFHQLTASLFADKIEVQRSSISHIIIWQKQTKFGFCFESDQQF